MYHLNTGSSYHLFTIRYSIEEMTPLKNYLPLPKHWEESYKNLTDYSQNYSVDKPCNSPSVLGSPMPIAHNTSQENKHRNRYCVQTAVVKHFHFFHLLLLTS
nr:MAG TPA: hypothetical protein [Caudoviricetes sp.]